MPTAATNPSSGSFPSRALSRRRRVLPLRTTCGPSWRRAPRAARRHPGRHHDISLQRVWCKLLQPAALWHVQGPRWRCSLLSKPPSGCPARALPAARAISAGVQPRPDPAIRFPPLPPLRVVMWLQGEVPLSFISVCSDPAVRSPFGVYLVCVPSTLVSDRLYRSSYLPYQNS